MRGLVLLLLCLLGCAPRLPPPTSPWAPDSMSEPAVARGTRARAAAKLAKCEREDQLTALMGRAVLGAHNAPQVLLQSASAADTLGQWPRAAALWRELVRADPTARGVVVWRRYWLDALVHADAWSDVCPAARELVVLEGTRGSTTSAARHWLESLYDDALEVARPEATDAVRCATEAVQASPSRLARRYAARLVALSHCADGERERALVMLEAVATSTAGAGQRARADIARLRAGGPCAPEPPSNAPRGLPKAAIADTINAHLSSFRGCYEAALAQDASAQGRVALHFTIDTSGAVEDVLIANTTISDPRTAMCASDVMSRLRFPKPEGGGKVIVTYPFVFCST